jgi:large subunit ribosomal protein L10
MVATWKVKAVEELSQKMSKSKTVGLVKITKIPSSQFQQMRKGLRGKIELKVTKGSIIRRACEKANIKGLDAHVKGEVGVVFSELGAFKLAKLMKTTKTTAPAKPGSIAEKDIIIPAGDTPFKPGPIIGDLQKVGIKAKIQGGKIVITDDSPVVKKGGVISADLANVLARLNIQPVELGLTINTAYESGMIYPGDILNIDTETVLGNMVTAHSQAISLAYKAEIYNKETIKLFLHKAFTGGISLALNTEVVNKETIEMLLSKANMQMESVAAAASGEIAPAPAEKKKEEPKNEEDAASGLASLFG